MDKFYLQAAGDPPHTFHHFEQISVHMYIPTTPLRTTGKLHVDLHLAVSFPDINIHRNLAVDGPPQTEPSDYVQTWHTGNHVEKKGIVLNDNVRK